MAPVCTGNVFFRKLKLHEARAASANIMQFKLLEKLKMQMNEKNRRLPIDNIIMKNLRIKDHKSA